MRPGDVRLSREDWCGRDQPLGFFLRCAESAAGLWFWRRNSVRAAVGLLLLFVFEVAQAPSWKAETATKAGAAALGLAGILAAVSAVVTRHRNGRTLAT